MANEIGVPPRQLAEKLKEIYEEPFGGKKRGRFRTSRRNIRRLAKLPVLTDSYIHAVYEELLYFDLILINIDSAFCVFPATIAKGFRRVPGSIIANYSDAGEGTEASEEEDD
jgi:hypothetical protein